MKEKYVQEKSKSIDSSKGSLSGGGPHRGGLRKWACPREPSDTSPPKGQSGQTTTKPEEAFIIFSTHFTPKNLSTKKMQRSQDVHKDLCTRPFITAYVKTTNKLHSQ